MLKDTPSAFGLDENFDEWGRKNAYVKNKREKLARKYNHDDLGLSVRQSNKYSTRLEVMIRCDSRFDRVSTILSYYRAG